MVCKVISSMKEIGKRIRELRLAKNLSQTQLANLINTTQDTISLWELGKSYPSIDYIIELVKVFNVSSDYLLGIKEI